MPYTRFLKVSSIPDGMEFIAASIISCCDLHFFQANFHFVLTGLNFGFHLFWPLFIVASVCSRTASLISWLALMAVSILVLILS